MSRRQVLLGLCAALLAAQAASGYVSGPGPDSAKTAWAPLIVEADLRAASSGASEATDAARTPPLPELQDGLGPGSAMQPGGRFLCTAGFLLRDPATGTYYLSTAGHCMAKDEEMAATTGLEHPDWLHASYDICVTGCISNALGQGTYVTVKATEGFHPVAYAVSQGVGRDFGILQLPDSLHEHLRPELPQWGGPTGVTGTAGAGQTIVVYGHGSYCCPNVGALASRTPIDQGRAGIALGSDGKSFELLVDATGGDSGLAVAMGAPGQDVLSGGAALGILTHGLGPMIYGTLMDRGLDLVRDHTGLQLELVLAGDPLPRGPTQPPAAGSIVNLTVQQPSDGQRISTQSKRFDVRGLASDGSDDGAFAPGWQVQVAIDDPAFSTQSRLPVQGNATWTARWDLAGVPAGNHRVLVRLVDDQGAARAYDNRSVIVQKQAVGSASATAAPGAETTAPGGADAGAGDGAAGDLFGRDVPAAPALAATAALALAGAWRRRTR